MAPRAALAGYAGHFLGDGVKRIIFEINEDNQGGADLRISTVK